jgi:hypothetical protein
LLECETPLQALPIPDPHLGLDADRVSCSDDHAIPGSKVSGTGERYLGAEDQPPMEQAPKRSEQRYVCTVAQR